MAGLQHVYQSWRKPFNPILGETWQAQLSDGTVVFMEQMSHHPPVTAFHMIGAGNLTHTMCKHAYSMACSIINIDTLLSPLGKLCAAKRNNPSMTISCHFGDVAPQLCYQHYVPS